MWPVWSRFSGVIEVERCTSVSSALSGQKSAHCHCYLANIIWWNIFFPVPPISFHVPSTSIMPERDAWRALNILVFLLPSARFSIPAHFKPTYDTSFWSERLPDWHFLERRRRRREEEGGGGSLFHGPNFPECPLVAGNMSCVFARRWLDSFSV